MEDNRYSQTHIRKWLAILLLIGLTSLLLSSCGGGQPEAKTYRVGVLSSSVTFTPVIEGFKKEMASLGYIEGKNITYDLQTVAETDDPKLAVQKCVKDKVDLIFAFPTNLAMAAKMGTKGTNIPVIFSVSGVEGIPLVNSVREPGGNITGVRFPGADLSLKGFELLNELVPDMEHLYVAYNPNYPSAPITLEALRPAVAEQGITLVEAPINTPQELKADLEARAASGDVGIDAILVIPENMVQSPEAWAALTRFAAEHNIPVEGLTPSLLQEDQGVVMVYGVNMFEMGELAAPLADRILKGTQAGTIPVVSPEAYLRINARRAEELGLTIPETLSLQAVEIIR